MTNETERAKFLSLLFEGGTKLINLRCFPGTGEATADEVFGQLGSAVVQRRAGAAKVSSSFEDDAPRTDIRAFVAGLPR